MKKHLLVGLLGVACLAGCPNDDPGDCGTGTVLDTDGKTCIAVSDITCGDNTMLVGTKCVAKALMDACPPPNFAFNTTSMQCEIAAPVCPSGTIVNATKNGCVFSGGEHGSLIFTSTSDKIWGNLRYKSGASVITVGNGFAITAPGIADTDTLYLAGLGANNSAFNATTAPMFAFGARPPVPVFWDANPAKPSNTPFAIDHQITVGEWKKCTQKWAMYIDPPRKDPAQHWYQVTVDATDCPADIAFGLWFNYSTTPYQTGRSLGTPAAGLPNTISTIANGTFHFERDFDPAVWTASGVQLNGNTHSGGPSSPPNTTNQGSVPNLTDNPDASFWIASFIHNDGQSNGNGGWCMGDPSNVANPDSTTATCGITNNISNTSASTNAGTLVVKTGNLHTSAPNDITPLSAPFVRPYIYLPGKVGFDSVSAFTSGADATAPFNTMPLRNLKVH